MGAILKGLPPNANPSPPAVSSQRRLKSAAKGADGRVWGMMGSRSVVLCHLPQSFQAGMKGRSVRLALPFPTPSSFPGQGPLLGTRGPICGPHSLAWEKCQLSHPLQLLPCSRLPQPIIPRGSLGLDLRSQLESANRHRAAPWCGER